MDITIENVTVTVVNDEEYRVKVTGDRPWTKTWRGESAWMNSQRHANDALLDTRGTPFGPQFNL